MGTFEAAIFTFFAVGGGGDADGGLYQWTGEIDGETFLGHYASEQGKTGTFTMQRAVVTSGESG